MSNLAVQTETSEWLGRGRYEPNKLLAALSGWLLLLVEVHSKTLSTASTHPTICSNEVPVLVPTLLPLSSPRGSWLE